MKLKLSILLGAVLSLSAAFATEVSTTEFFTDIWNFMAPIVADRTDTAQVPNHAPGLIVYETGTDTFYGRRSNGGWKTLSGEITDILPSLTGKAGQTLIVNSGETGVEWSSYPETCILRDVRVNGSDSGNFPGDAWAIRQFDNDKDGDCSWLSLGSSTMSTVGHIDGNYITQFTLPAGKYSIEGFGLAYRVDGHKVRLYSVTGTTPVAYGTPSYTSSGSGAVNSASYIDHLLTIGSSTTYRLEHWGDQTQGTQGFGEKTEETAGPEIYAVLKITRYK